MSDSSTIAMEFTARRPGIPALRYQHPSVKTASSLSNAISTAMPAELRTALISIDEIIAMPADWDGYGALPINARTASNAKNALKLLLAVTPTPDITPNTNGTISLEWESSQGVAHLEIGATRFSLFIKPTSGRTSFADGLADSMTQELGLLISAVLYQSFQNASTMTGVIFAAADARIAY